MANDESNGNSYGDADPVPDAPATTGKPWLLDVEPIPRRNHPIRARRAGLFVAGIAVAAGGFFGVGATHHAPAARPAAGCDVYLHAAGCGAQLADGAVPDVYLHA